MACISLICKNYSLSFSLYELDMYSVIVVVVRIYVVIADNIAAKIVIHGV